MTKKKVMKSLSKEFYEDGYEDGREAGLAEGLAEGVSRRNARFVSYNLEVGKSGEQIVSGNDKDFFSVKGTGGKIYTAMSYEID